MSLVVYPHSQQQRHVHHAAAFAAFDHQRISPRIRVRPSVEGPVTELRHGLVQFPSEFGHLGFGQRRHSQRLDQALHLPSGDTPHIGFGDDLHERPLRAGTGVQQPLGESTNPAAASGVRNSIEPTRVSQRRVRYPLRRFTRSGLCFPQAAPQTTSASADISPCAKLRTISPNRSLPSASNWLRNHSNTCPFLY